MSASKQHVGFVSLGCPKALVDSERILTQLRTEGYATTSSYDEAEVVIINTCGFIDAAKAESLEAIQEAMTENGKVIVTGCMGASDAETIQTRFPDILSVTGPQAYEQVLDAVHAHAPKPHTHDPFTDLVPPQGIKLTPRHYAYLKISEGCDHKCSFCIIPSMRGKLHSRPIGEVMKEAEALAAAGVRELLVISQDTSAYGTDMKHRMDFWGGRPLKTQLEDLCKALGSLGIWVRLHYVYPYPSVDRIIPLMAEGAVLPYLDIPFQHGSPKILKLMRRPGRIENTLSRIHQWREQCPELALRSTFIVGFPGEREEDFEALLDFIQTAQLDRVGCFTYSAVDGAQANQLPDPVSEEVKQERYARFMEVQAAISAQRLQEKVGSQMQILIDEVDEQGAIGRSYADAPEIDGKVFLDGLTQTSPGSWVDCEIDAAGDYDLWGKPLHS
ncbi:MAG: 30S ribosomal protein S12 methylthiotransferase RimO [Gammaproteobacteria bacterium]|nr:30S ribosomal protein S12 methylthiotransferase RimO [Gammaproteobacteria bacterium]